MRTYVRMIVCLHLPRLELVIAAGGPRADALRGAGGRPGGALAPSAPAGWARRPALARGTTGGPARFPSRDRGAARAAPAPRRAHARRAGEAGPLGAV